MWKQCKLDMIEPLRFLRSWGSKLLNFRWGNVNFMTLETTPDSGSLALHYFQVYHLFDHAEIDALLNQPRWATRYLDVINEWKSSDNLKSSRVRLPSEIVLQMAKECTCVGDLYADADGERLYIVTHDTRPFRSYKDSQGKVRVEYISDVVKLSVAEAFLKYGADAVWLAEEYGSSRRGEKDNRFGKDWPPEPKL